jgi:hypothetical protein
VTVVTLMPSGKGGIAQVFRNKTVPPPTGEALSLPTARPNTTAAIPV